MQRVSISKTFLEELDFKLGFEVDGSGVEKHASHLEYCDLNRTLEHKENEEIQYKSIFHGFKDC